MAVNRPCRHFSLRALMGAVAGSATVLWLLRLAWQREDWRASMILLGVTAAVIGPMIIALKCLPLWFRTLPPSTTDAIYAVLKSLAAVVGFTGIGQFCVRLAWPSKGDLSNRWLFPLHPIVFWFVGLLIAAAFLDNLAEAARHRE